MLNGTPKWAAGLGGGPDLRAQRYEHSPEQVETRAGHYERKVESTAEVALRIPELRSMPFETAIIEHTDGGEQSVEEALAETFRKQCGARV